MRKLACKAALPRGKKHDNTITPPHVSTKSLSVTSGDSSVCLVVSETADGAGLWISDAQDSLKGIAIYRNKEQMAIGLRSGKGILAAALSVDAATGEGQLQLTQASGETEDACCMNRGITALGTSTPPSAAMIMMAAALKLVACSAVRA